GVVVAVADRLDLEALGLQGVFDPLGDRRLVLDDQDPPGHQLTIFALGTTMQTRVPEPGSDSSSIPPSSPSTASSAIPRPMPQPAVPVEVRWERWQALSCSPELIPRPASRPSI